LGLSCGGWWTRVRAHVTAIKAPAPTPVHRHAAILLCGLHGGLAAVFGVEARWQWHCHILMPIAGSGAARHTQLNLRALLPDAHTAIRTRTRHMQRQAHFQGQTQHVSSCARRRGRDFGPRFIFFRQCRTAAAIAAVICRRPSDSAGGATPTLLQTGILAGRRKMTTETSRITWYITVVMKSGSGVRR